MTFEEKIAKLRDFGKVSVTDFFPGDGRRVPYRYAQVSFQSAEYARIIGEVARLCVEIDAHLSFYSHYSPPCIDVSISRALTADEIGDDPPFASRSVSQ